MSTVLQRVKSQIINAQCSPVFFRSDFNNQGSYSQIGRVLRTLVEDGVVMKMGHGIYIKARRNRFTGELMPDIEGGMDAALLEVLKRLKVNYELCGLTDLYMRQKVTQLPARIQLKISKSFKRKLAIGDYKLNH